MFMIFKRNGVISTRPVRAEPVGKRRGNKRLRTREGWAMRMYQMAVSEGSLYFAFRHGKSWWVFDTYGTEHTLPIKELPSQEATEMWLMYRG